MKPYIQKMEELYLKQKKVYKEILEEYKKIKNNNKVDNSGLNSKKN